MLGGVFGLQDWSRKEPLPVFKFFCSPFDFRQPFEVLNAFHTEASPRFIVFPGNLLGEMLVQVYIFREKMLRILQKFALCWRFSYKVLLSMPALLWETLQNVCTNHKLQRFARKFVVSSLRDKISLREKIFLLKFWYYICFKISRLSYKIREGEEKLKPMGDYSSIYIETKKGGHKSHDTVPLILYSHIM